MSFLKNAIEALDPAPNKKTELTLALQVVSELAEQKIQLFRKDLEQSLRTAGTPDNQTIPITQILAWHAETRAYVKSDVGKIADVLIGSIKKFIGGGSGEILDGIGELATGALEGILGSGSGTQSEVHTYYIVVEGLSIVRFDLSAWSRRIEATGITTQIENALAFQAAKSSVNVDAITFNTFLQAYKAQLEKLKLPPDKLKAFILESKEIFELLRDNNGQIRPQIAGSQLVLPGVTRVLVDGVAVESGDATSASAASRVHHPRARAAAPPEETASGRVHRPRARAAAPSKETASGRVHRGQAGAAETAAKRASGRKAK